MAVFSERPRFYAATGIVLLLLGLLLWERDAGGRASRDAVYAEALREMNARVAVSVRDRRVAIADGELIPQDGQPLSAAERSDALRLAYALSLLKYDPLFSLEGTDTVLLRDAIDELARMQDAFAALQETDGAKTRVANDLYPISFLRLLASLEDARREAIARGTEDAYEAYALKLGDALAEGERRIQAFRSAYELAVADRHNRIAALGGSLTKERGLEVLTEISDGYARTRLEMLDREACVRGRVALCRAPKFEFTNVAGPAFRDESLMRRTLSIYDDARDLRGNSRTIIALENSSCMEDLTGVDYVEYRAEYGSPYAVYTYVGDIILRSLASDISPSVAWFASKGVTYLPYNPLISYTCPLTASDMARVASLHALAEKFGMTDTPAVYESAVLARARAAYEQQPEMADDLRLLHLAYADRSAAFEDAVHNVVHGLRSTIALRQRGSDINAGESVLFATHSAYMTLFMAHNPSFVPVTPVPYVPDNDNYFWRSFFLYSQARELDTEWLARDIGTFFEAHTLR